MGSAAGIEFWPTTGQHEGGVQSKLLILRSFLSASHRQTTDSRHAHVFYPLHPLAGQTLWIRERRLGPPPTFYLVTPTGEGFNVPVWMTEPSATHLDHQEHPRLYVRALLEICELTRKGLESIDLHEEVLPSDQAKETPRESQPTPTDVDTQSSPDGTASAASRQSQMHRAYRKDAGRSRPARARHPRISGGER
jgi:hypothetical protein